MDLLGRRAERDAIERLLALARTGHSGAMVVRGEAGIGKTALLEFAQVAAAPLGFRVESSTGVEAEAQFAFAGLHQVCAPLLALAGALPDPQQAALGVAFGRHSGAAPDRFLVGLATLNLFAEAAEVEPLLCVVDDVQWLDDASAQVLAFVARRVNAERLALVYSLRDSGASDDHLFIGLTELRLAGLGDIDARALLTAAAPALIDDSVRDRVLDEARGNPLALLEMPRSAPSTRLAGAFQVADPPSIPGRIEDSFQRRSANLPGETQLLLLVAAAEPTGDVMLLWRTAEHLGIDPEAAAPAEAAGLLEIDTRVRFHHPLVRSAVYGAATPPDRRRVHGALAAATDPENDPDRRAWHRAQAVLGNDEDAAADLERSAGRARARGGLAAAATFLQRAAQLTPDPACRAARSLEAAYFKHGAGGSDEALNLLEVAATGPLDALQHARLDLLRAQIAFHTARNNDVLLMLLDAARKLAPLDPALSRETYLYSLDAALVIGGLGPGLSVREVAEAARAAPEPPSAPGPSDLLLDALVTMFTRGYEVGVPGLRTALDAFCAHEPTADDAGDTWRWGWLACRSAMAIFDDELFQALADRHVRLAREAGALATLPAALLVESVTLILTGKLTRAAELADQQTVFTAGTKAMPQLHAQLILNAWRGRPQETAEIRATIEQESAGRGEDTEVFLTEYAMAVLHNGTGDYPAALEAAARAYESDELTRSNLSQSELIEAAFRAGKPERAVEAMEELSSRALVTGTAWGLGLAARSRALTSAGPEAEGYYLEAIDRLRGSGMVSHLARAHLVYGEWLRREGRRQDARVQLRTAHDLLSNMGAEAFAARAARELRATGEHPRKRNAGPTDKLTSQELQVARLVATGATSREVGAQLFLSPRTIEAHLRNIFRKLGITSRRELKTVGLP